LLPVLPLEMLQLKLVEKPWRHDILNGRGGGECELARSEDPHLTLRGASPLRAWARRR
jgi:hypothetical protein